MDSKLYDDVYDDYIGNILDISSMSDKEHFIFYNFKIENDVCFDDIYMLNKNGEKGEFGHKNFVYNDEFYDKFLKRLVSKFGKINTISSKEVIHEDNYVFKLITDNRDIFTIEGLSLEKSNELLKVLDEKEEKNILENNNEGKVNYLILVFIIVLILFVISLLMLI